MLEMPLPGWVFNRIIKILQEDYQGFCEKTKKI